MRGALALRLAASGWRTGRVGLIFTAAGWAASVAAILLGSQVMAAMTHEAAVCGARSPVMMADDQEALATANVLEDRFGDRPMTRVVLSDMSPRLKPPPGLVRLPGQGEAFVSPALARMAATQATARAAVGGTIVGEIGPAGLTTQDELYAYVGSKNVVGNAFSTTGFGAASPDCSAYAPGNFEWGTFVVLVLGPALLVGWSFSWAAGRRRQARYRALHLLGVPGQVCGRASSLELASAALLGALIGTGAFFLTSQPIGATGLLGVSWYPIVRLPGMVIVAVIALAIGLAAVIGHMTGTRVVAALEAKGNTRRRRSTWLAILGGAAALSGAGTLAWLWAKTPGPGEEYAGNTLEVYYLGTILAICGGLSAFIPAIRHFSAASANGPGPLAWRLALARLGRYSTKSLALALTSAAIVMTVGLGTALTHVSRQLGLGVETDWQVSSSFDPSALGTGELTTLLGNNGYIRVAVDRISQPPDAAGMPPLGSITVGTCQARARAQELGPHLCQKAPSHQPIRITGTGDESDRTVTLVPGEVLQFETRKGLFKVAVPQAIATSNDIAASAALLVPIGDAPWIKDLPEVTADFSARPGAEYDAVLQRIHSIVPDSLTYTHVNDESALRRAERLQACLAGLSLVALTLIVLLFVAAASQTRLDQAVSRATLQALGTPRATLARSLGLEAAIPIGLAALFFVPVTIAIGQIFEAWYFPGIPSDTTIATNTVLAAGTALLAAITAALAGSAGKLHMSTLRRPD